MTHPSMHPIPDPQAEMERLAAARKPSGDKTVTMTVEPHSGPGQPVEWMVTIERGNARHVQVVYLTAMERAQLACLLDNGTSSVTFVDVTA